MGKRSLGEKKQVFDISVQPYRTHLINIACAWSRRSAPLQARPVAHRPAAQRAMGGRPGDY